MLQMLYIFCCVLFSSPNTGQSGSYSQLLCSLLSAFPRSSVLITRLLNNPCPNLCQLALTCVSLDLYISTFREHFWTRLMKSHSFAAVALLLLSSQIMFFCKHALGNLNMMTWEKKKLNISCLFI